MISFVRRFGFWIFLALFFIGGQLFATRHFSTGSPPPIDGQTIAGEPFNLERLAGEPSVIYFWASWCGICATMDGMIGSLSENHPIITVVMQSGEGDEVQAYMEKNNLDFPVIVDSQGKIAQRYGVNGVAALFVLDSAGAIRFSTRGYTTGWGIRLRLWLAGLMAGDGLL